MHFWLGACKKQIANVGIRRNAFGIVTGGAVLLAVLGEVLVLGLGQENSISWWNLLFSGLGIGLGLVTFKLLYRSCY